MARIEYNGPDDPDAKASIALAEQLGLLLMSHTDKVNIALTALSHTLSATLTYVPDSEFESTLGCIGESIRVHRAQMLAPPKREMN